MYFECGYGAYNLSPLAMGRVLFRVGREARDDRWILANVVFSSNKVCLLIGSPDPHPISQSLTISKVRSTNQIKGARLFNRINSHSINPESFSHYKNIFIPKFTIFEKQRFRENILKIFFNTEVSIS